MVGWQSLAPLTGNPGDSFDGRKPWFAAAPTPVFTVFEGGSFKIEACSGDGQRRPRRY
jgi:hypothetical protein